MTDVPIRQEAAGKLTDLFRGLGEQRQQAQGQTIDPGQLTGLAQQVAEFMTMPLDVAQIFIGMSTELANLVLDSLEEAGFVIVKGVTPL